MDLDFDDSPSDQAAPAARAGARFKPKGRPQPKKKQVSFSESQTTLPTDVSKEKLSTQSKDLTSLDESWTYPNKDSTSETNVSESGTGTFSENADILSRGFDWSTEPYLFRTCTNVDSMGKRCDDDIETAHVFPYDPKTKDSEMFGDFVTPLTDEDICAQAERMQTEDGECHLDMETLDIVHDEGITSAYEQHTGKFQPKPRLLDPVIEEPESHYSVDETGYFSMDTNEEDLNIPEVLKESVPEMEVQNASGGWEHEEQVVSHNTNNTVLEEQSGRESKKGKSKKATGQKRKNTSEGEPNKSSENLEKKFKKSSRRQKRTLEKELLETPDDEIRFLPIRDMLRLVEYKEWLEKKEGKGAPAAPVPPTQEAYYIPCISNMNEWNDQYHSQDFGAEDEFGMEESENQETNITKPDSPVNYQTYMNKSSRTKWSKEDTQLFYEGIQEFGSNLSMVQQLFPDRTRQQIKLKFKLEERRFPLKLNDALSSRPQHLTHFKNVIKKLQQEAAAAREGEEEEEEETGEAETTTDVPEGEEPPKSEETERVDDGVKETDGGDVENVVRADGGDEHEDEGDDDFWNSYKSDM